MIRYYYKNINYQKSRILKKFTKGSWICVNTPSEQELTQLSKDYKLDTSLMHDALDLYEMPRIEVEDGATYFFTRSIKKSKAGKLETCPVLTVIGDNYTATISSDELPFVQSLLDKKSFYTTQKAKVLLHLLMSILNDYRHEVHQISKEVQNLSSRIERITNEEISKFVDYERILNDFMSTLIPTNMLLKNLLQGKIIKLFEEDSDLVEDLSLSIEQLMEIAKSNIKNIVNTREAYSAILSNNLNKTMKLLTSVTVILTIPTIISSFFGMNVSVPLQGFEQAFTLISLATLILVILIFVIFARNKLL